jgi:hypothetical protein
MTGAGRLHGVRHADLVTAAKALTWFAASERPGPATGGQVIGYLLAPDRAQWFRCDGGVPLGPDGARDLDGAFEVFVTSGGCQLRWMHHDAGVGTAVGLAENPALLPRGDAIEAEPARHRLAGLSARLLAGQVIAVRDGWATLASARYAPCVIPVAAAPGQQVCAELAEYVVSDEHGNLSVAGTLLLSLVARTAQPAATERPA